MATLISFSTLLCLGTWLYLSSYSSKIFSSPNNEEKPASIKIAAVGDLACAPGVVVTEQTCQTKAVLDSVRKSNPAALLIPGDLQYPDGGLSDFQNSLGPMLGDLKEKSYATPGNHEYNTKSAKGYFDFWNGTAYSSKQAGNRGMGYYSFNVGTWHIIALNSNCEEIGGCDADSAQGAWLAKDLKDHQNSCTLAFWHHPVFTSGYFHSDPTEVERGRPFWQLLETAKADIILNGHEHYYERFKPQLSDGTPDELLGIRQFIVGTGGKDLYDSRTPWPNQEKAIHSYFGFLQLTLEPEGYEWAFIDSNGAVSDKGRGQCR